MASVIKLRKGLNLNLAGKAAEVLRDVKPSETYALVPDDYHGVTPKVVVKPGDKVKAGDVLFYDKNIPAIKFVSPVSGEVTSVNRGERRKILSVTVKADGVVDYKDFGKRNVGAMSGEQVKEAMLEGGVWPFVKQRPYDIIANPNVAPRAIFVTAFDTKPLAPNFDFVLKGREADFKTGMKALGRMAKTYLSMSAAQDLEAFADGAETYKFSGPHPAGNVGVQINNIAPVNKGEVVWTLSAWDVLIIGRLFNEGVADLSRTIAVVGSEVKEPSYANVRIGQQLGSILAGNLKDGREQRIISGNVLTGTKRGLDDFLGAYDTEVTVIPEGNDVHEALGWIMPRFDQFSVSRSYFNWILDPFKRKEYKLDARVKGGERHMIMSHEYGRVLPMSIMPEYLIKAIIAGDIDRMEALGIYEVAPEDFALCEFVCSSKMELQRIVRDGLDLLYQEMV